MPSANATRTITVINAGSVAAGVSRTRTITVINAGSVAAGVSRSRTITVINAGSVAAGVSRSILWYFRLPLHSWRTRPTLLGMCTMRWK